jgi:hypothetical protein
MSEYIIRVNHGARSHIASGVYARLTDATATARAIMKPLFEAWEQKAKGKKRRGPRPSVDVLSVVYRRTARREKSQGVTENRRGR